MLPPQMPHTPKLPDGWAPPMPFSVRVGYRDCSRRTDALWTMPLLVDNSGQRVLLYQGYGPAGSPAGVHELATVDLRQLPYGSRIHVPTECDQYGRTVYAQVQHTMN